MMSVESTASRPATKQPEVDDDGEELDHNKRGGGGGHPRERKQRNSGDILARRRFENIRKHSARTRHRTGIVNAGEKNRLTMAEKQLAKSHRIAEARIRRMKEQLRRELHEMEAGRRALKTHSICVREEDRDKDRQELTKYCQRGRYLYAIRNETKSQREDMDSYNDRLEKARQMLQPARRMSLVAMDKGKLLGQAPPISYLKVGRRVSVVEAPAAAKLLQYADDSDEDEEDDIHEVVKKMPIKIKLEKPAVKARRSKSNSKTPPPFDLHQLRREFCPELRKELETLMMDDPNVMLGAPPISRQTTRESRRDILGVSRDRVNAVSAAPGGYGTHADAVADANRPEELIKKLESQATSGQQDNSRIGGSSKGISNTESKTESKLKLPPVHADKSLVGRIPTTHKTPAAAKQILSTVTET